MKKILLATLAFLWLLTGLGGRLVAQENIAVWQFPLMQETSDPVAPSCVSDLIQSTDCELTVATDGWTFRATDYNNTNTVLCGDETNATTSKGLRLTNSNGNFTEASIIFKISTAPYGSIRLNYDHRIGATGGYETETWSYSTNGVSFTEMTSITGATTTYATELVDFSSVSALNGMSSVWFKLTVSGATVDNAVTAIDNVVFTGSPMTCLKPINVTAVANDPHSAVISWDPQGTNEESYTLVYYTSQLSTTALNTLVNTSDAHVITNATSPYTLTGLNGNTTYHVYLRANCGGDDNSIWTDDMTFTTPEPVVHVITIGDGTGTGYYVPVNTYYNYSLSQQIYTPDDIEMAGTISSVAFYHDYSSSFSMDGIRLYMKHTTKSSFASNTDMVSLADATLVYEGTFGASGAGWITLQLSTPFEYNGTDNLLICMFDQTSGYPGSSYKFRYTGTGDNYTSIMYYSDSYTPDINNVSSFSGSKTYNKYHNNIQLGIAPNGNVCFRVSDVVATNLTASSAVIGWTAGNEETAWVLKYGAAGFNVETAGTEVSVETTPSYSLSGLSANTAYDVYVKAVCGATEESRWTRATFTTYCNAQAIPYTVDFESFDNYAVPNCWTQVATYTSGNYTYPCVNNSTTYAHNSSSKSLRMYTYYYYNAPENIIAMPPMDDINTLQISFWARYYSTNPQSFQVGYVKNGEFTAIQTIPGLTATYQQFTVYMSEVPADADAIAFRSYHASSSSYVHIDDIEVSEIPSCVAPDNIVVSNITATTASVSWTDVLPTTAWQYQLGDGDITDIDAKPIELTGLNANTEYTIKVRSACGGDYSDWSTDATFTTSCNAIVVDAANPFSEDFADLTSSTFPPQCWSQERTAVGTGSSGTDYPNGAWTCYTSTQGTGSNPPMAQLRDSRAGARHNLVTAPLSMATGRYIVSVRVYRSATGTNHTVEGINLYLSKTSDLVSAGNDAVDLGFISRNYTVASGVNSEIIGAESGTGWYTYNIPFDISSDGVYYVIFEGRNNYGLSTYMDDVLVRTASTAAEITAFSFAEDAEVAVINSADATVTSLVSYQTESLNGLVPTIAISDYATIAPASGVAQDFTGPVTYTVTAEDGTTTKEWTVNVSKVATASSAKDILTFTFSGQSREADIDAENHTVTAYAAWNYDFANNITPTITVSPQATIYPVSDSSINFATPVTYTVTAEDESTQDWTVTIINDPYACVNPLASTFTAPEIAPTSATITWWHRYLETSYNVKVSTTTMTDMTATADVYDGVVNDTTIALTGLAENTQYYMYVQSACGIETWISYSFRTIVSPATIPYVYAFEDATENNNWVLINGEQTNKWYIGTVSSNSGNGLYISNDNGTTNAYTTGSLAFAYAYRTISMGTGDYVISYDWKAQGESQYYDFIRVWLAPASFAFTPGQAPAGGTSVYNYNSGNNPSGWISLDESHGLNQSSSWQSQSLTASVSAGTYNLVFMWANDGSDGSQPPASIDNISVIQITCPVVADIAANNVTTSSADITWTERGTATAWGVVFSTTALSDVQLASATPENVTAASYQATGLTPNTPYYVYVRANCSDEDQSDWVAFQFRTECGDMAVPFTETFTDYTATAYSTAGVMSDCWSYIYNGTNTAYAPHVSNSTSYSPMSGDDVNYLCAIASTSSTEAYGNNNIIMLPPVEGGYANRNVSFDAKTSSSTNAAVKLGYMNGDNFVNLTDVVFNTSAISFSYVVPNTVPESAKLALNFSVLASASSTVYYGIDNVTVREVSTDNTLLSYSATTAQGDAICNVDNDAHTISVVLRTGYDATAINYTIVPNDEHATVQIHANNTYYDLPATPRFFWYMTSADTTVTYKVTAENGAEQLYLANVSVEACGAPSALVAEQTSLTNVNCSWTPAEGTSAWNFYCSTTQLSVSDLAALTSSDYTTVTTTSASVTVVGETTYYWYVRADCGGNYSEWMSGSFSTWENCVAPTNLATSLIGDNDVMITWDVQDNLPVVEMTINDGFERTDINGGDFSYTNSASGLAWSIVSSGAHGGNKCLKSASGTHSSTSQISMTLDLVDASPFSFWYKVSSESGWDEFSFAIDGTDVISDVSGEVSWTQYSTTLAAGTHTLAWKYTKDGSASSGSDCAWIDDISLDTNVPGGNSSVVIYRDGSELATVPATQTSYTDEGLAAGHYCYTIKTLCREGSESELSAPVCQDINDCLAVTNVSAGSLTDNSAVISWTRGTETSWNLKLNDGTPVALTTEGVTVNGDVISYALTGLEQNTTYTVAIQSNCDGTLGQNWASVEFTTERTPATLPYVCGFEEASENANWIRENGDQTNKWYFGTAAHNSGTNGMYISSNNGTGNTYNTSSITFVYAYRPINIPATSEYVVSYDWKANGESNYDYLRAWLAPTTATLTAGQLPDGTTYPYNYTSTTPTGWISLDGGSKLNLVTSWQTKNQTIDIPAGNYNLVFMWANDGGSGSDTPAAIDNIDIHALTCPTVGDLAAAPANITSNSAVITWTERGTAEAWEVVVSATEVTDFDAVTAAPVSDASYSATGLDAETTYHVYVRANCDVDDNSQWAHATFTTVAACPAPDGFATSTSINNLTTITWNGYTASNWTFEYRLGTTGDWTVVENVDAATYTITTTPSSTYNVRVKAVCDVDVESAYSTVFSFTTPCGAITEFPWNEGFENGIDCWTLVDGDADGYEWYEINLPQASQSNLLSTHGGSYMMTSASWASSPLTPNNWLISPALDLTALSGTIKLSYFVGGHQTEWPSEHYKVCVSTSIDTASFTTILFEETIPTSGWLERYVDLSAYVGQMIYIAFVHYDCTDMFRLDLDDISVYVDNSTDAAITEITAPTHGDYSSCALTDAEQIKINIQNNGGAAISNFEVSYSVNGGAAVTETVTASIAPAQTYEYTFVQTADLSAVGDYTINASVNLTGDETADNNSASMTITSGDATIRIHALTDSGSGQSWSVTNTITNEVVAGTTTGWQWYVEVNEYVCVDASQCYRIVVNDEDGGMTGDAYVEILYNGVQVAGSTEPGSFNTSSLVAERFTPQCNVFTITASAEGFGSIDPTGTVVVNEGESQTFTMTPMDGFALSSLLVDGVEQLSQVVNNTYTFENVTADHTIVATFDAAIIITATAGNGGSIDPAGQVSVGAGANATFTVTADEGYTISSVLVDGTEQITDAVVRTTYNYTFENVTTSHTIAASFVSALPHVITATASAGGSISPSGQVSVPYNGSQTFEFTAEEGYSLANVTVDNVPVTVANNSYTFTNVIADHTINANFSVSSYNLTIHYVYADNTTAAPDHTETVVYNTAYSVASPEIAGYTADQLTVAGTMPAQDVEVTVTYNVNNYNLTIHYVYADNTEARPDYTAQVAYNATYSVESPVIECYTANTLVVEGTMPAQDVDVTVIYNVDTYTLTIHYVYADNTEAREDYTAQVACGDTFSVESPVIDGYTADPAVVEGTMPAENHEVTVTYNEIVTHNLTIHYVYAADNTAAAEDHVEALEEGAAYSVQSPVIAGYTADQTVVEGTMGTADVEVTVRYTANTHTLTIHYVYAADNTPAADDHVETLAEGAAYSVASPEIDGYTASQLVVEGTMGTSDIEVTVRYTSNTVPTYTLTIHYVYAETNAQAAADHTETLAEGAAYSVTSPVIDGYTADQATVAGTMPAQNVEVTVRYTANAATTYTIVATAGNGGTITPNGTVTVNEGADQPFTITANAGYRIASVLVDGVEAISELANNVYAFTNVTANHTIAATFEAASSTTYTIIATAGSNGTITPNGVVTVAEGANQTFRITPSEGYRIASVMVDNEEAIMDVVDNEYVFYNVTANHTINVTFTDGNAVDEYTTASMSVYPNPNNGMFSIDFSRIEGDATYQLIDARGAVVETRDINVMDGDTMNFNHDLRPGTYFVRIVTADKVYVEQIVVE
ncbi:MAG: choice-of-anchor J domain-containing protein [Bacteroidales bacterium]|nr:choice-of-anchor J domain-containing protein [Bacteroidales bacterium]